MAKQKIEEGSHAADPSFKITVTAQGPYLVYGRPPLAMQFIMPNERGESWYFQEGLHFTTDKEPTALCRCGASHNKPYCDGEHLRAKWDPHPTADTNGLLDNIEITSGEKISLTDNSKFCAFARFCDAAGGVWRHTESSDDRISRRLAIRGASMCPSGRLLAWNNASEQPYEPDFEPSLGLIEDDTIGASGGLWVRGGIRIEREDGRSYEIRNRNVLCRCGHSGNKPYCDGSHASLRWRDELEGIPDGATIPEEVY